MTRRGRAGGAVDAKGLSQKFDDWAGTAYNLKKSLHDANKLSVANEQKREFVEFLSLQRT